MTNFTQPEEEITSSFVFATCQYEYEVWDQCDDPAVGWFESPGWRGWLCETHRRAYGVGR